MLSRFSLDKESLVREKIANQRKSDDQLLLAENFQEQVKNR